MVALTTAKSLIQPANSSYVGIWDQPINYDLGVIDACLGQIATVSLNNSPVTLAAAQFQSAMITFNSTLTGSVAITFPTSVTGFYTIQNICTGSSAFVVTLQTTAAGGQVIACMPYEPFDIINDGTNIKYKGLGRVGTYWDYAGSSVPAWVSNCTIPPYLNCDGTAFSSVTYPALAGIMGGTTLPDSRGRGRVALNQTTARITSAISGVDGNTLLAAGGSESLQLHTHTATVTDPGHTHATGSNSINTTAGGSAFRTTGTIGVNTSNNTTGITVANSNTGAGGSQNIPPSYVGGLTLVRAA